MRTRMQHIAAGRGGDGIKIGDDIDVPESACPSCGKVLDCATAVGSKKARPAPGDFTVCLTCGHLMAFGYGLQLRELTFAEIIAIAADPRILAIQRVRASLAKEKKNADPS